MDKRYKPKEYRKPINSITSKEDLSYLEIVEFPGGYGRTGLIWVGENETCDVCQKSEFCICIDSSEAEYGAGRICRNCISDAFGSFYNGSRGETPKVYNQRKKEWDEREAERVADLKAWDEEVEAHRNCQDPNCKSRVHPIKEGTGLQYMGIGQKLLAIDDIKIAKLVEEDEIKSALAKAMSEPIIQAERDNTKIIEREE